MKYVRIMALCVAMASSMTPSHATAGASLEEMPMLFFIADRQIDDFDKVSICMPSQKKIRAAWMVQEFLPC